jgi:hypothetical protein
LIETDRQTPANEVFDLRVHDSEGARITIYRSERIPGLYPADTDELQLASPASPPGDVGTTLRLELGDASEIRLSWSPSCIASEVDYEIYEGVLGDFSSHVPAVCSTGGRTSMTLTPLNGDRYYLTVPTNGADEGSHGKTSSGSERQRGPSVCLSQTVAACP